MFKDLSCRLLSWQFSICFFYKSIIFSKVVIVLYYIKIKFSAFSFPFYNLCITIKSFTNKPRCYVLNSSVLLSNKNIQYFFPENGGFPSRLKYISDHLHKKFLIMYAVCRLWKGFVSTFMYIHNPRVAENIGFSLNFLIF